ncbi:MAG TPA: LacI family DNA-binding transcriptional regulator [Anaeromyxobacteraceae bacterium]|nr:LacI family DNA-binding transcriptional regulator [Anaeromyxobacteraceae bacterium]
MSVRIVDIARTAGVSPATVSLALNGKPGVGDDTRRRIAALARKLGYRPLRPAGRPARPGESICLLHVARHGHTVNRDHDVFIADYIDGLGQASKQAGLKLEIATFKHTPIAEIIERAEQQPGAGLVVLGTELSTADVAAFSAVGRPLVFLDTWCDFLPFDFVDMNNRDAVFTVVSHLAARGHRRIGMVKAGAADGGWETRNLRLREEAFVESLARCGLPFEDRFVFATDSTFHGAHDDMLGILRRGAELPSALFCANDIIACGCLKALSAQRVRVPHDVSLVGFDDLPLAAVSDPPLTTVQVSKAEMGRTAVQLLVGRISGENTAPPVKVLVGGRLVERESVRLLTDAARAAAGEAKAPRGRAAAEGPPRARDPREGGRGRLERR